MMVLVLDRKKRFDYEHEHYFIEHEHDRSQKDMGISTDVETPVNRG
jgi:hypothetical protein